ncbi:MAG: adenine phosphoribosyltransferase [Phycisphaerae bacterium]|nr:adenine phosphoribosyltransferase [Gemmatimonadaceae bacterium]
MNSSLASRVADALRTVPDFPKPGIQFKDITPLLANPSLMQEVVAALCAPFANQAVSHVVGIESRGFLFGVPAAMLMQVPFVPARKPGKLPRATVREVFTLEYGADALEVHADALDASSRVLIVDDILATGGTLAATCRIVERMNATVAGISVLGEIGGLGDPQLLAGRNVSALLSF